MSWFLTIIILSFTFNNFSEARHEKKLPSALVVGTVYCDTCFQEEFSKTSHFISGASVAVECGGTSSKPSFREEVKTNEGGEFRVHLPFSVSKHVKKIKGCSVKLISSSEPYCAVASTATSSSLHLKSRKQGTHIFSAGFFTFKPLKQPNLCYQRPSFQNTKEFNSMKPLIPTPVGTTFPPIDEDIFPPLPQLPNLPPLPQLPPLPPLPNFPPKPKKKTRSKTTNSLKTFQFSDQKVANPEFFIPTPPIPFLPTPLLAFGIPLPPNPFLPPPSVLPPNPFLPPPSILPPNPFQPPPSILPPNPFQPPPSILPPNPFQPPAPPPSIFPPIPNPFQPPGPPPSIFPPIPNPFQPSPPGPPPLINLPPIPGLTPTPSPPPPPAFPFPFPPFPFQPSPGFPGIPPASSSKETSP
uniref:Putative vegetative cell wall protein gp1 n=1 Tax=Davidia involucrata TaxID=16924 RepID=A0A5B6ZLX9_DAVIN